MDIKSEWLEKFKAYILLFIKISDREFDKIQEILSPVFLSKGDMFVGFSSEPIRCGFIIKGVLRTYFVTENGEEFITDLCHDNQITTNYDSITSNLTNEYYSQALEESTILAMNYNRFLKLGKKYPVFETFKSRLIEYYYNEKINREKELLSLNAKEKYLRFIQSHGNLVHRIPQYHVASYLGITPVQLSRVRKELKS
ncbi:MAG: Crp/Fnr family transcriptional regulator [Desulfobacteraceae bacterium]|nr:Crp/Fnr family transcriptional regulator [Desulfobacteraceae bacterium]